jgi:hypothetical protein
MVSRSTTPEILLKTRGFASVTLPPEGMTVQRQYRYEFSAAGTSDLNITEREDF